jgi:NAD(P)-dependent dehydrogenase (short-subunit alcohol dehydrogenase family)
VDGEPMNIFEAEVTSNSLFGVVSESTQVSKAMEKVVEDFGKIDVFVANAGEYHESRVNLRKLISTGMAISKPILEQTLSEYQKQMSVNGMAFYSVSLP